MTKTPHCSCLRLPPAEPRIISEGSKESVMFAALGLWAELGLAHGSFQCLCKQQSLRGRVRCTQPSAPSCASGGKGLGLHGTSRVSQLLLKL